MNHSGLSTRQVARLLGVSLNRIRYALLQDSLAPKRNELGHFAWTERDICLARELFHCGLPSPCESNTSKPEGRV